jgi:hypothetical protein
MIVVPVALNPRARVGRLEPNPSMCALTIFQELYDAVEEVSRGKVEGLLRTGGLNVGRSNPPQTQFSHFTVLHWCPQYADAASTTRTTPGPHSGQLSGATENVRRPGWGT